MTHSYREKSWTSSYKIFRKLTKKFTVFGIITVLVERRADRTEEGAK